MRFAAIKPAPTRWLVRSLLPLTIAFSCTTLVTMPALAQPPPGGEPTPSPTPPAPAPPDDPGGDRPQPALNSLIDPALLESVQRSIVGVVTVWEEPDDLWAMFRPEPEAPAEETEMPVISFCTGWFEGPSSVVTAGHCVDPEEGRLALDMDQLQFDPESGIPLPPPPGVRPEPKRTVYVFQPRELPGAIIGAPTEVRVHSFRPADEGDTAKLEIFRAPGAPPAPPLPVAPTAPKLGEAVTSIGFPDVNIAETDGVDLEALLKGAKSPAEVLQDSRLQPSNTSGTITARQFREGVAVHQINADVDFGTSGGPTINSRGEVLGINSMMTISFAGNFNIITDTGMLREFLGHDQPQPGHRQPAPPPTVASTVAPSTAPAPRASGNTAVQGSLPPGWLLPIPILGAVILGAGLIWLLTRRNASVSGSPTEEETPSLGKHARASD